MSDSERVVPRECTLFMTDRCNFKCGGCSRSVLGARQSSEMTLKTVSDLLAIYPSVEGFCVAGLGEPTLCRDFTAILDHLAKNGKFIGIITNGTDVSRILELGSNPGYISISLYGHDREGYLKYTGLDAFDVVIRNYGRLKERFKNVGFSFIARRDNMGELDRVLSLCDTLGPDFMHIHNYLAYDHRDPENIERILRVSDADISRWVEGLCGPRRYVSARPVALDSRDEQFACRSYDYLINLDGKGNIGGCQRQVPPDPSFGNIYADADPFNTPAMLGLRARVRAGLFPHEECRFCFGRMRKRASDISLAACILFHEKVEQTIECVQSLLSSNVNIYILNNNSSAESLARLKGFCDGYERIKIFDSKENLGVGNGRNYLISHTTEKWLLFLDNDITVKTDGWLERFASHAEANPEIEAFVPRLFNVHEDGFVRYCAIVLKGDRAAHVRFEGDLLNVFPGGASFVNRSVYERIGLYDEQMFVGLEDFEFSIRAMKRGEPLRAILISDIELVHDHRKVVEARDRKAVLARYDIGHHDRSQRRIAEKYDGLVLEHESRPWAIEQVSRLLSRDEVDLKATTPERNFGSGAAKMSIADTYPDGAGGRRGVYEEALAVARRAGCRAMACFGCGDGTELMEVLVGSGMDVVGIDSRAAASTAALRHPRDRWIECDFASYASLEETFEAIRTDELRVFLVTGLLERLDDPRPLLRTLKRLLLLNPGNLLCVSTPDRAKKHGSGSSIREWTMEELLVFLASSGLSIKDTRHVAVGEGPGACESFVIGALAREEYEIFLQTHFLPPMDTQCLVLTEEYAKAKLTGGIGTYVEELRQVVPGDILGICLLGRGDLLAEDYMIKQERLIIPDYFFEPQSPYALSPEEVLRLVEQVVFMYPNLKLIEYQDIGGSGFRLDGARDAGLIPADIVLRVRCHGTRLYLENARRQWLDMDMAPMMERERCSVVNADIISFPTDFLKTLYTEAGYELPPERVEKKRLPFSFKEGRDVKYESIDTLIFFGKRIFYKGYTHFAGAVKIMQEDGSLKRIRKIILLGPKFDALEEENGYFESLKGDIDVVEVSLKRADALAMIAANAPQALCIMPLMGDNHPYSILETINAGCHLLTSENGGIPELIPARFHPMLLCEPAAEAIAKGIKKALSLSGVERGRLMTELAGAMAMEQASINSSHIEGLMEIVSSRHKGKPWHGGKEAATVIIPSCKAEIRHVEDLIYGLNRQSLMPEKVIFIEDCGDERHAGAIETLLSGKLKIPFEIIRSGGIGTAAARNAGLSRTKTEYTIILEPHNIPKNDFVGSYMEYLRSSPYISAVTCYYEAFDDGADWLASKTTAEIHRPFGDFSMILGQTANDFGHANSAFRTVFLKEIGGWSCHGGTACHDWALFLKIRSNNGRIGVVPKATLLCRKMPGMGDENAAGYPEQLMLARATKKLSGYDAFRLQAVIRNSQKRSNQDGSETAGAVIPKPEPNAPVNVIRNHPWSETAGAVIPEPELNALVNVIRSRPYLMRLLSISYKLALGVYRRAYEKN